MDLVSEHLFVREHHGDAVPVTGLDHLGVAHRATGLRDRGDAGLSRVVNVSANGKKVGRRRSNAIAIARGTALIGLGLRQSSRCDAVMLR